MEHMHQRPRRRREKKLMTMDEVNEKFPMMKYKNWVAQRAKAGLPTAGGVSAPPSRAGSIRSVHGATVSKERASAEAGTSVVTVGEPADKKPQTETAVREVNATGSGAQSTDQAGEGPSGAQARPATAEAAATGAAGGPPGAAGATTANDGKQARQSSDDEEEDEHINAALPPELLGSSGDTCAICIDTLENDDDIRGLTCGHAFHASCLDPWLTSRRASCPLCKADYYTPKPRPPAADDGAAADPNNPGSPHNVDPSRMNMPNRPIATWYGIRGHRIIFSGRLGGGQAIVYSSPAPPVDYPDRSRGRRSRRHQAGAADAAAGNEADGSGGRRFHIPFFGSRGSQPSANSADQAPAAAGPRAQPSAAARASSPANAGGILSRFRLPRPSITVMRSHRMPPAPVAPLGWEPMASGANVTPSQLEAGVRNP